MLATYPLIGFAVLAVGLAWAIWTAIGLAMPDLQASGGTFVTVPGAWAPTIAALIVTARCEGGPGVRRLLARVVRWRFRWWWYLVAVVGPTCVGLVAVAIHVALGGDPPSLVAVADGLNIPADQAPRAIAAFPMVYLVLCFGGPLAEETGWRGFAQHRLQQRIGPARAGLAVGVLWSLWHLPLLLYVPSGTGQIQPWFYLPFVAALGVIFAWGYNRTDQSVLFTILLHAGVNTFFAYRIVTATDSRAQLGIALVLVLLLAAAAFRQMARESAPHPGS